MTRLTVRNLKISCYRSHRHTLIETDNRSVVLHGDNGSGKTNVLDAVSLLSPGRGLRGARAADSLRKSDSHGWKVAGCVQAPRGSYEVETWYDGSGSRRVRSDDKAVPQAHLGQISRMLWLVPVMDRIWVDATEGRRRLLDRMTMNFRPDHVACSTTYSKALRTRNRMLKDGERDSAWYAAVERQMAVAGAGIERNRRDTVVRLREAGTRAVSGFPAVSLSLLAPEEREVIVDEAELIEAFSRSRGGDLAAGRTRIGPHRTDMAAFHGVKGIAARQCSTGEQKALLVSLVLSCARAVAENFGAAPILLLDDVTAHLDETRRHELFEEINAMSAQAWMTGTDVTQFAALGRDVIRLAVTMVDEDSVVSADDGHANP